MKPTDTLMSSMPMGIPPQYSHPSMGMGNSAIPMVQYNMAYARMEMGTNPMLDEIYRPKINVENDMRVLKIDISTTEARNQLIGWYKVTAT